MATWTIEEKGGRFTVSQGRFRKSFSSHEEALGFLRDHRSPRDKVVQLDEDGYRTPITRKRWRQPGLDL